MKKLSAYANTVAYFATKHEKHRLVEALFSTELGITVQAAVDFDTDIFGTFCHSVQRESTALATCIKKAQSFAERSGETLILASEGSFGPHPDMPWLPCNEEIMVFWDASNALLIYEVLLTTKTNYASCAIHNLDRESLDAFLLKTKFPSHRLMLLEVDSSTLVAKGIEDHESLQALLAMHPKGILTTDMRAHLNPTRQETILTVAQKLATRIKTPCPSCNRPGFGERQLIGKQNCPWCGLQTHYPDRIRMGCVSCLFYKDSKLDLAPEKLSSYCDWCNP